MEKCFTRNIIVISIGIQEITRAKCKEYGALAFLNKPPKNDKLMQVIKNFSRITMNLTEDKLILFKK